MATVNVHSHPGKKAAFMALPAWDVGSADMFLGASVDKQ
jgi:hypothetical protein